ncbi:MAG: hypothetical protein M3N13_00975, partial [Candidatus Eremiobacteraeota bacterium]|nr:hypothetical protein [Candidatus Eremiobacteraeota bacterium]
MGGGRPVADRIFHCVEYPEEFIELYYAEISANRCRGNDYMRGFKVTLIYAVLSHEHKLRENGRIEISALAQ